MQVIDKNKYINLFSTVRLCANYVETVVTVQQIGPHACGFNGFKTQKGVRFVARHSDRLELLYGTHAYEIEFNPPPSVENFAVRKRSYAETEETDNRAKMLKLENCSEKSKNDREEEERLSSNSVHSNRKEYNTDSSTSSEQSSDASTSAKWDSFDKGKLLIYTAPSVPNRAKVILIIDFQFYLIYA